VSSFVFISRYRIQSSARSLTCDVTPAGRSFRYSMKSNGPRTVPCGTPEVTCIDGEEIPSRTTFCVLFVRKLLTHLCSEPVIPACWSFSKASSKRRTSAVSNSIHCIRQKSGRSAAVALNAGFLPNVIMSFKMADQERKQSPWAPPLCFNVELTGACFRDRDQKHVSDVIAHSTNERLWFAKTRPCKQLAGPAGGLCACAF